MSPLTPELAHEIEQMREDADLNVEELLASLRQQHEQGSTADIV